MLVPTPGRDSSSPPVVNHQMGIRLQDAPTARLRVQSLDALRAPEQAPDCELRRPPRTTRRSSATRLTTSRRGSVRGQSRTPNRCPWRDLASYRSARRPHEVVPPSADDGWPVAPGAAAGSGRGTSGMRARIDG